MHRFHQLRVVIETVCDLGREQIEGEDKLLSMPVPGDFVVRLASSVEQRVRELEQILWKEPGHRVQLNLQQEARDVFVAAGDFALKPLQGRKDRVTVYGQTPPEAADPNFGGGGSGSLDEFLKALGTHINQRIVKGDGKPPTREFSWHFVESIRATNA